MHNKANKTGQLVSNLISAQLAIIMVVFCLALQQFTDLTEPVFLEQIELQAQSDCDSDTNKQDSELKFDSDKYFYNSRTINNYSILHHSTNLTLDKTYASVIIENIDPPPEFI